MKRLKSDLYHSEIGDILILGTEEQLCYLDFSENSDRLDRLLTTRYGCYTCEKEPNLLGMQDRLDRYFNHDFRAFEGVRIETDGTDFQRRVWRKLQTIPVGQTISYHQLAASIDQPKAIRAAASANARNPVSIIIPCHRVIGKNGALRGYAGGEHRKAWLLSHEGAM